MARTELNVVNACLATMGQRPINAITDPHPWRSAAQDKLVEANTNVQGRGWWFNMELLTLTPSIVDSNIYLPSDTLDVRTESQFYVMRTNRVFNLNGGTYLFTSPITVRLIRNIPFADMPSPAQDYIEALAVLNFQRDYDGDSTKTRQLTERYMDARAAFNKSATLASKTNMIDNNVRLARIKFYTRGVRAMGRPG
jgi:Tail tubular protein